MGAKENEPNNENVKRNVGDMTTTPTAMHHRWNTTMKTIEEKRKGRKHSHSRSDRDADRKHDRNRQSSNTGDGTAVVTSSLRASQDTFGKYGVVRESDLMTSAKVRRSFEIWLEEVKNVPQGSNMARWETSNYFKDYAEDYNTATFPHSKYYDYDKWEMEEYNRQKKEASREGRGKAVSDEFEFREEMRRKADMKKQKEFDTIKTMMSKEKIEEMKRQARLKAEMVNAYRVGDEETRVNVAERLQGGAVPRM